MTNLLAKTLDHLEQLVSFDTRNPPRAIQAEGGIFDYIRGQLPGFDVEVIDHGDGAVSLFAVRGAPTLPTGWTLVRSKRAGDVGYHLARRGSPAQNNDHQARGSE